MKMQMTAQIANHGSIAIPLRAFADRRLTGSHYRVLAAIAEHIATTGNGTAGCAIAQSELAAAAGVHPTTAPRLIADLVEWRYVATMRSDSDRRRLSHTLIQGDTPNNPPEPVRRAKDPPQQAVRSEIPPPQVGAGDDPEPATDAETNDGGKAMVGQGDMSASPAADTSAEIGTELPADWRRTMDRLTAAEEARATQNLPLIDLDLQFDRFMRNFIGTGIRRPDWDAAWIEWAVSATPPPEPKPATAPVLARQGATARAAAPAQAKTAEKADDFSPF
jgi:DNA-binding MarR family transcriptional regulator